MKLRLGVIGAGAWTVASHLPNLRRRVDEIDFVAVNNLNPKRLESIQQRYGFRIASTDYREVLTAGVDICVVASPARWHHEHARAALEAGAHVLVEKPVEAVDVPGSESVSLVIGVEDHPGDGAARAAAPC